ALDDSMFLAPAALTLIRVGERSGNLSEMVSSVASLYHETIRKRTRAALSIIEPVAIVLIGAVIGLVAIAIFQAITSINNVPGL
ncbi:MAG TPA: type II secretion system F family protein, partial [Stellaceae bacterium]|nr:type II secretion system F family protein [Stellaceae bacterium]